MPAVPLKRRRIRGKRPTPAAYRDDGTIVSPTIYIFPRQWFVLGSERFAGPPGLSTFDIPVCGESGTYAVVEAGTDYLEAVVYESDCAYDCFHPAGPWHRAGRLCDIRGVQILRTLAYYAMREPTIHFRFTLSAKIYRTMHVVQGRRAGMYLRLQAPRMPGNVFAIYMLHGISDIDAWWHAGGYSYVGFRSWSQLEHLCRAGRRPVIR